MHAPKTSTDRCRRVWRALFSRGPPAHWAAAAAVEEAVVAVASDGALHVWPADGAARPPSREPSLDVDSPPEFEVLGPAPAPLARLRGQFRYQLLVKGSDRDRVRSASEQLSAAMARLPRDVRATLDVNPVSML